MIKYIKTFFGFILPILGKAALQVSADELTRWAYPERKHTRRVRYTQRGTGYSFLADPDEKSPAEADMSYHENYERVMHNPSRYHDVLMVAFDVTGKDPEHVHEWLHDQMPEGDAFHGGGEIYLDSWWVANDERFDRSDCDSAVFCAKGKQKEARQVLAARGLSHELFHREDEE